MKIPPESSVTVIRDLGQEHAAPVHSRFTGLVTTLGSGSHCFSDWKSSPIYWYWSVQAANMKLRKYKKRVPESVTAVQLNLRIEAFRYKKWGHVQRCKSGDWLVDNDGDIYTVERKTFGRTYRRVKRGQYVKSAPVWATVATTAGRVSTKEGTTRYKPGDYLVYNNSNRRDGYAMGRRKFERMYKPTD
jgi:hypothetical protein